MNNHIREQNTKLEAAVDKKEAENNGLLVILEGYYVDNQTLVTVGRQQFERVRELEQDLERAMDHNQQLIDYVHRLEARLLDADEQTEVIDLVSDSETESEDLLSMFMTP